MKLRKGESPRKGFRSDGGLKQRRLMQCLNNLDVLTINMLRLISDYGGSNVEIRTFYVDCINRLEWKYII